MKYDVVFIVLVYRNCGDLADFLNSVKTLGCSRRVLVVNSYYDDETQQACKRLAAENDCDFISVENRGYGYGNNRGLEYALENYDARYVVISNPDIKIKKFDVNRLSEEVLTGPKIIAQRGRNQNPLHYRRNLLVLFCRYLYAKSGILFFYLCAIAFNKIEKAFCRRFAETGRVYALHGSFVVMPYAILQRLGGQIFDERMFLYCEENHLAELARKDKIRSVYDPELEVLHKEDGSVSLEDQDHFRITRDSLKVFFDNWKIL